VNPHNSPGWLKAAREAQGAQPLVEGDIDAQEAGILAHRLRELMLAGACGEIRVMDDFVVTLTHPDGGNDRAGSP